MNHNQLRLLLCSGALVLSLVGCAATQQREPAAAETKTQTEAEAPESQPGFFGGPSLPEVSKELVEMGDADQDVRKRIIDLGAASPPPALIRELVATDQNNTARLKDIIERYGWPTQSLVGEDAAEAAWLIAQHADQDAAFQAHVLELIKPLVAKREVDASNFALLTDRVRVAQNRPQLYGTQYQIVRRGGQLFLSPATEIEDPDGLDARRAAVGLGPHSEYVEQLRKMYLSKQTTP